VGGLALRVLQPDESAVAWVVSEVSVMGKRSRDKGKRGELEACEALKDVWPGLQRTYHQARAGSDAPDIDGPGCGFWLEVKRTERLNIHEAMEQALTASMQWHEVGSMRIGRSRVFSLEPAPPEQRRPPAIVHKRNRGEWLVTVRARDLARLMGR
jgi:hypothetical protein